MPVPLIIAGVGAIGSAISAKIQGDQAAAQAEKAKGAMADATHAAEKKAVGISEASHGDAEKAINSADANRARSAQDLQASFAQQATQAGGLQNQQNVFNQLQNVASGQGPNPAQAMLAQATGANTANQAALMAGQRGAGANAGLLARQAAMQGGANQQAAAGQGATMQANQSLGALNQLGGIAGQQVGQALTAQQQAAGTALQQAGMTQQAQMQAAQLSAGGQQAAMQQGGENARSAMAAQQAAQKIANEGINKAVGSAMGSISGGMMGGGGGGGGGGATGMLGAATGDLSSIGKGLSLAEGGQIPSPEQMGMDAIKKEDYSSYRGRSKVGAHFHSYATGGKVHNMKVGGHVPGKPKVGGARDSYANDTVDAKLSPGEIVLPRSVTQSADPVKAAAAFVAAIKSKKKGK